MRRAYVIGTFDTKGIELSYVAGLARAAGVDVVTVDVSTGQQRSAEADVTADDVAAHHPDGAAAVFTGDRGRALEAMAVGLQRFLTSRDDVRAVLGLGGSGGTAVIAAAMRALPVGVGKLMVSTVASGDVAPYVGAADIAMWHSVTDVAGLNRISRQVLGNAAPALAGIASHSIPAAIERPAVGLTMFGVTTPCVRAVVERIALATDRAASDAVDPLVFHATGTGGKAMEKLLDDGMISSVLDLTTTEVCDQ